MKKSNKDHSKYLWGSRFRKDFDETAKAYTHSFGFDYKLYKEDISQSIAHVRMLEKADLLTHQEQQKLSIALKKLKTQISTKIKLGGFERDEEYEDIHTYIEKNITKMVGEKVGVRLHTARSRNDQVSTDMRLYIRNNGYEVAELLKETIEAIFRLVDKNKYEVIMPAYTHMQIAKPIYFRDYIRCFSSMFKRDLSRLSDCLRRLNFCPLGSGAVGGTHYKKINRWFIAKELGFTNYLKNTVDAVSDRDFVIEYLFVLAMIMMHVSRMSEDFVIWSSPQFKFITIDDSFMTGSSILPQKKNPDVCEIARGKTGRVYGNLFALLTVMKGLPISYNRDMQEDKESLFDSIDTVVSTLLVYTKLIKTLKITRANKNNMLRAIQGEKGFANAPRYVDYLVEKGHSLRMAYHFVSKLVHYCDVNNLPFNELDEGHIDDFIRNKGLDRKSINLLKNLI